MELVSDADVIAASLADGARFGELFDRHATVLHRYIVRRIGPAEADALVGETFRIAFERRATFDGERPTARPWLYGIATNLVARHRRSEGRRIRAVARLAAARDDHAGEFADTVSARVDAARHWDRVAEAVTALPELDRDALVLHVWERLSYAEIADALAVPIGTVRSRINRARTRVRELVPAGGEERDDETNDPAVYARVKEQLMTSIDQALESITTAPKPDIYPRLAYNDELGAVDYLTRVFGFTEQREARMEFDGHYLCWLRIGNGIVMLGHANAEVHRIHSPRDVGLTTAIMHVYVPDIDSHYAHAVAEGADITMDLRDAFYGDRVYEATDPEGHRWHFGERFDDIRARGGRPPEPEDQPE